MQHLEVSGAVVLYIGRTVSKGLRRAKLNSSHDRKEGSNGTNSYKGTVTVVCSRICALAEVILKGQLFGDVTLHSRVKSSRTFKGS
jgi:hypothetical protein